MAIIAFIMAIIAFNADEIQPKPFDTVPPGFYEAVSTDFESHPDPPQAQDRFRPWDDSLCTVNLHKVGIFTDLCKLRLHKRGISADLCKVTLHKLWYNTCIAGGINLKMEQNDTRPLMVSIHCITYNHEPYIRQCLEGFVMQKTNFRFEAVVHDDASTDGTATIIREFAKKYPDIIKPIYESENQYSKHDGSLGRIMNNACTGKYIAYCEGDDYWTDPLKLQKQVDFLEAHPEYSMCYSDVDYLEQSTGRLYDHVLAEQEVITTGDLMVRNRVYTLTVVTRKSLERRYEKECLSQMPVYPLGDYPCWLWMSLQAPIYHSREKMGVYRKLEESASNTKDPLKRYNFVLSTHDIKLFFIKNFGAKRKGAWRRRAKYLIREGRKVCGIKRMLHDLFVINIKKRNDGLADCTHE